MIDMMYHRLQLYNKILIYHTHTHKRKREKHNKTTYKAYVRGSIKKKKWQRVTSD